MGHATTIAPALLGVASLLSVGVATVKLGRSLRRHVAASLTRGPADSVVVGGRDVVGVVGLRRPRLLVSAGALSELDDEELTAALANERAHIRRGRRYVLVYAELCGAIARALPGTQSALDELVFHSSGTLIARRSPGGPIGRRSRRRFARRPQLRGTAIGWWSARRSRLARASRRFSRSHDGAPVWRRGSARSPLRCSSHWRWASSRPHRRRSPAPTTAAVAHTMPSTGMNRGRCRTVTIDIPTPRRKHRAADHSSGP